MKKTQKLIPLMLLSLLLAACGGGGGSSDTEQPVNPTEPIRTTGFYMTAITNPVNLTVKSVSSSRATKALATKLVATAGEIVNPEDGEDIDPSVGLYATDEGGKEFRIHFSLVDEDDNVVDYDEKVEPKSAIQITPDTVYLELWVKVNTNARVETRQYMVQFSAGKMIEVQRGTLGVSFLNEAYKYVLPANSLHNGTDYPIVLLSDHKWYQLDADWDSLTYAKELVSNYVADTDSQGPAGNLLVTADKEIFKIEQGYVTHNNHVVYQGKAGIYLDDQGQVVVANYDGLFLVGEDDKLEQFSRYDYTQNQAQVVTGVIAKSGERLLGAGCRINRDNNGVMETLSTADLDVDAYYAAGAQSMVCVDRPDEDFDYFDLDAYCGETHVWDMYSVSVDGVARRDVRLNALPYKVTQVTEDTAYALMRNCVQAEDGTWSLAFQSSIINFADNSVTPVNSIIGLSAFIH